MLFSQDAGEVLDGILHVSRFALHMFHLAAKLYEPCLAIHYQVRKFDILLVNPFLQIGYLAWTAMCHGKGQRRIFAMGASGPILVIVLENMAARYAISWFLLPLAQAFPVSLQYSAIGTNYALLC